MLRFAKLHLNKPKDVWSNFLMDRSDQSEQLIPTAKHDGGELMIWQDWWKVTKVRVYWYIINTATKLYIAKCNLGWMTYIYIYIHLNFDASVSTNLSWTFHFDSYILIFSLRTINWMSPTTQTPFLEVRQLKSPAHTPQWCSSRWPLFSHQHFCRLWELSLNIFIWRTDRTLFNLGICPTAAATFFFN